MAIWNKDKHNNINPLFNAAHHTERNIDELIGLCKGVIADGNVNTQEAKFIMGWLDANHEGRGQYPGNIIYPRLQRMLEDNIIDHEEERELLELLLQTTGGAQNLSSPLPESTTLPLCDPMPAVEHTDKKFVITGTLLSWTRTEAKQIISNLGGSMTSTPSTKTDFLIIAQLGSKDWIHSTHGRKIERAAELRTQGKAISIVSEKHWIKHVPY